MFWVHIKQCTYQVDEGEEDDDDCCDGALCDGMVHVRDDPGDRLAEPGGAQRVADRLRRENVVYS